MIRTQQVVGRRTIKIVTFETIHEIVQFIHNTPKTKEFEQDNTPYKKSSKYVLFSNTESMEEAEDLLLHGWETMSKQLTEQLKVKHTTNKTQNKQIYAMQGYQASVPRYLQGIPDNMINSKKIVAKQKVVNIVKDIGYSSCVSRETIIEESTKVLELINRLETQGYRVNLYVSNIIIDEKCNKIAINSKIKESGQRMNVKQLAFPLVNPSMLRRIFFAIMQRLEESRHAGNEYGIPSNIQDNKHLYKHKYILPSIIQEETITNIEKYYVN